VGSKFHLVWAGTTSQIRNPELMHSTISGGDDEWKSPRAPFFGQNKGRVRKVSIGKTRNLMAVLFQRSLRQGNDAYEVLLTFSSDQVARGTLRKGTHSACRANSSSRSAPTGKAQ